MNKSNSASSREGRYDIGAGEYRLLFESTMDVLIVYDPQSERVVMCNLAACNLFGYDNKECFMKLTPA